MGVYLFLLQFRKVRRSREWSYRENDKKSSGKITKIKAKWDRGCSCRGTRNGEFLFYHKDSLFIKEKPMNCIQRETLRGSIPIKMASLRVTRWHMNGLEGSGSKPQDGANLMG